MLEISAKNAAYLEHFMHCPQRPCGPVLNNLFLMIPMFNKTETYLASALFLN